MAGSPQARRRVTGTGGTGPREPGARLRQAVDLGFRRVSWVRIVLGPDGARCDVVGTVHRRPRLRRVPLRTATALMAAGVPGVVRRVGDRTAEAPDRTVGVRG